MKSEDTRIEQAGVFRCCLASVARERLGEEVNVGDESSCDYCGERFRLVEGWVWKPLWQLERG
jgi:hypothetical protein